MLQAILRRIVENQVITYQIEKNIRQFLLLDFDVRHHSSPITNFTTGCRMEHGSQTIGDSTYTAIFIAVFIVDGLHTASAGNVILGSSKLHYSSIRQWASGLHQSFSKRTATYNHSTVEILESSGKDFGSGSRSTVHQYSNRDIEIQRFT